MDLDSCTCYKAACSHEACMSTMQRDTSTPGKVWRWRCCELEECQILKKSHPKGAKSKAYFVRPGCQHQQLKDQGDRFSVSIWWSRNWLPLKQWPLKEVCRFWRHLSNGQGVKCEGSNGKCQFARLWSGFYTKKLPWWTRQHHSIYRIVSRDIARGEMHYFLHYATYEC